MAWQGRCAPAFRMCCISERTRATCGPRTRRRLPRRFDLDLNKPLDQRMAKLDALNVTFHAKLGTQGNASRASANLPKCWPRSLVPNLALVDRAVVLAKGRPAHRSRR